MPKSKLGIIGSGRLGTAIARQSSKAGYEVRIANSRGPESLGLMLSVLLPGVIAGTVGGVIEQSDIIVLAIPLNQYKTLKPELFAAKVVIDAMNYWPPTEGAIKEFMNEEVTSSEYIQHYLKGAHVVKTLNHIAYNELEEHNLPAGDPKRRAMVLAGDDKEAKTVVSELIDAIGFDPVDLGELKNGKKFQPDTSLFNARYVANDL
ncbi:MAG: coenzyme F420-dependent oxidoreductase [Candidatus Saccharibacteria bacterium]|nr:coenzyme F420-dependent oxidoreductase [Candidatus Saccharibacteria bacterium]